MGIEDRPLTLSLPSCLCKTWAWNCCRPKLGIDCICFVIYFFFFPQQQQLPHLFPDCHVKCPSGKHPGSEWPQKHLTAYFRDFTSLIHCIYFISFPCAPLMTVLPTAATGMLCLQASGSDSGNPWNWVITGELQGMECFKFPAHTVQRKHWSPNLAQGSEANKWKKIYILKQLKIGIHISEKSTGKMYLFRTQLMIICIWVQQYVIQQADHFSSLITISSFSLFRHLELKLS